MVIKHVSFFCTASPLSIWLSRSLFAHSTAVWLATLSHTFNVVYKHPTTNTLIKRQLKSKTKKKKKKKKTTTRKKKMEKPEVMFGSPKDVGRKTSYILCNIYLLNAKGETTTSQHRWQLLSTTRQLTGNLEKRNDATVVDWRNRTVEQRRLEQTRKTFFLFIQANADKK